MNPTALSVALREAGLQSTAQQQRGLLISLRTCWLLSRSYAGSIQGVSR